MDGDPAASDSTAIRRLASGAAVLAYWRAGRASGCGKALDVEAVRTLIVLRDFGTADQVLADSERRHPDDFYLAVLRSDVRQAVGDAAEARRMAEFACGLDPSHLMTRYRAGLLAIRMRDFDAALHHLDAALGLFLERPFWLGSPFPLLFLLRIYAVAGPSRGGSVAADLARFAGLNLERHVEVSPFLERVAASPQPKAARPLRLGLVGADPLACALHEAQAYHSEPIRGYRAWLQDLSQHHLRVPGAVISGSFGAVWSEETCFALDHGFHSSLALAEFDVESKTVLTHDTAIAGFSLRDRRVHLALDRPVTDLEGEFLVIPPCHHVNFGHLVHDVLANKSSFDRLKRKHPGIRPLLLRRFPSPVFQMAFEWTFGSDYLVVDDVGTDYRASAAHLLTLPHAMWPDEAKVCIEPARHLRRHLSSPKLASRRIFVSREAAGASEPFRAVFEAFGFDAVSLESLPPERYFDTFADVSHIAGLHGAGLMNFVFAPNDVRVFEVKRPGGNWHSIAAFAAATQTDLHTSEAGKDLDALRRELSAWLAGDD